MDVVGSSRSSRSNSRLQEASKWEMAMRANEKRLVNSAKKKKTVRRRRVSVESDALSFSRDSSEDVRLVDVDIPTIQDVSIEVFGTKEEQQEFQKTLLKRTHPSKPLYGHAKTFLNTETKRLADGIRGILNKRETFVAKCEDVQVGVSLLREFSLYLCILFGLCAELLN